MTGHSSIETIDPTQLAHVAGGLVSGDGGCIRPLPTGLPPPTQPRGPFDQKMPWPQFDPTKITPPSAG